MFQIFFIPNRLLSSSKIIKGRYWTKEQKDKFFMPVNFKSVIIFYKYAFIGESLPLCFVFIASALQICCFTAVSRFLCSAKFHN